jgi:hypothetical protein
LPRLASGQRVEQHHRIDAAEALPWTPPPGHDQPTRRRALEPLQPDQPVLSSREFTSRQHGWRAGERVRLLFAWRNVSVRAFERHHHRSMVAMRAAERFRDFVDETERFQSRGDGERLRGFL